MKTLYNNRTGCFKIIEKKKPSPKPSPNMTGFWACKGISGCCYNNNSGTIPKGSTIALNFTGGKGINYINGVNPIVHNIKASSVTPCIGMEQCWINLGGGESKYGPNHITSIKDGKAVTFEYLQDNASKIKQLGYTGVSFDYESDVKGLTFQHWVTVNNTLQQAGLKTAITTDIVGLGLNLDFGVGCSPRKGETYCSIIEHIPFDYNIPQLYGGWPLFYTGQYSNQWEKAGFHGYWGPPCKGSNLLSIEELKESCKQGCKQLSSHCIDYCENHYINNNYLKSDSCTPLKTLAELIPKNTKLIPSFGGKSPPGGLSSIDKLTSPCGDCWDKKSFVSWNITDPNIPGGGGNFCS